MKLTKICRIEQIRKDETYDIHHVLSEKNFWDSHPNLIVEGYTISNCSRHAGGLIITEDAFRNMPVIKSGGVLQTPWSEGLNFRHLEYFGMLKFDILGLGTLRMFEDCIRKILKKEGHKYVTFSMVKDWYYKHLHPDNNNMDDIRVYKHVYWEGNFAGIFQFVQPPAQKFIAKMQPRSVLDIATATSIFRPGPLSLNVDKSYLKNRKNPKGIKYRHPLLEEVLGDTAGLLVFQEQLQQIYHKLAGVPLEDTDKIRKAFTKKDLSNKEASDKARNALRDEFVSRCKETNDVPEKDSGAIFDEMEQLIAYSFNCCLQFDTKVLTYNKEGMFLGTKEIQNITSGTYVKSRDETTQDNIFVEVKENHNNGIQEVFEFMFENGRTVCCTMNHKFRTISGEMVEISEILDRNLEIVFDDEKKTMHPVPGYKQMF